MAHLVTTAISWGIAGTTLLALILLWLQKRSGMELDGEQYRGFMLMIFLINTLSAYVLLEYFQHRENQARARAAKAAPRRRPQPVPAQPAFTPIFVEPEKPAEPQEPAPPPEPAVQAFAAPPTAQPETAYANAIPQKHDASAALFTQAVSAAAAGMDEEPNLFMQFGIHLFVMGGCGEMTRRKALPADQGKSLLIQMMGELGMAPRAAAAFAANANTFAQVPNFRGIIDAGYAAMANLQEAGFVNIADFLDATAQWKVQEGICQPPEPMTFMTTSVGVVPPGTPVTPEDRSRILRAHNMCIGEILERCQGREIHNLGNGVVAAFTDASLAVRAAQAWQEHLELFARENPTLIVAPRVGIDTEMAATVNGNYVSMGLTRAVSIAAITPAQEIYCSEATKDDSTEVVAFDPVERSLRHQDLPPLHAAQWTRLPPKEGPAVEYRHIGTMADAS